MRKILKIFVCFIGIMISASTVSASKLEILSESEDYEKIVELADEIVSVTNGGPVEDPFEEGIRVSDIDFDNALKEYIDTQLLTSELLSVSEVESALEQSDYIWIIPIRAYGHLYEACAVRANGEDGQPIDQWHISGARGYELDDTPTYIEQLNISLAANPDIVWDNYKFRLVGGVDPIRFPVWITFTETQMEYLIPGREDAAACLTDSSEIAEIFAFAADSRSSDISTFRISFRRCVLSAVRVLISSSTDRLYEKSCSSVPIWCLPSSVTCCVSSSSFIRSSLSR